MAPRDPGTGLAPKGRSVKSRLDTLEMRAEESRPRRTRKRRAELGPLTLCALEDPDVLEIIANPPKLGGTRG